MEKDTLMEESNFLNTLLKKDALREERDPGRKRHPEGRTYFLNTLLKKDALREENISLLLLKHKTIDPYHFCLFVGFLVAPSRCRA